MKQGLLSQEILVHDESSLRKITELSSELEERVIKVEHLNLELQKTKAQLYDVESKLLSSDEEISRVLLKLAEKEEAISQLETMVETQKKQISDSTSQMQKVQADWLAGQSEIKKISMALNSVNETFQIELRGKVEVENNLRYVSLLLISFLYCLLLQAIFRKVRCLGREIDLIHSKH